MFRDGTTPAPRGSTNGRMPYGFGGMPGGHPLHSFERCRGHRSERPRCIRTVGGDDPGAPHDVPRPCFGTGRPRRPVVPQTDVCHTALAGCPVVIPYIRLSIVGGDALGAPHDDPGAPKKRNTQPESREYLHFAESPHPRFFLRLLLSSPKKEGIKKQRNKKQKHKNTQKRKNAQNARDEWKTADLHKKFIIFHKKSSHGSHRDTCFFGGYNII